jgi:5-methylcytosine-specific restriction endonuclease McrA
MRIARLRVFVLALIAVFSLAGTPTSAWSAPTAQKGRSSGKSSGRVKVAHVKEHKAKEPKKPKGKAAKGSSSTPRVSHASHLRCESCDRDEHGKIVRSRDAKKAFKNGTGFPKGRPGYVIDHIVPLACGGADRPSNMQWQTKAAAKAKDKVERVGCGR